MNYQERLDELRGITEEAQRLENPSWMVLILKRIKQLRAAQREQQPDGFFPGMMVVRMVGPRYTGQIVEPTRADHERAASELRTANADIVLVQWRGHRSWEYLADLRLAGEGSRDEP